MSAQVKDLRAEIECLQTSERSLKKELSLQLDDMDRQRVDFQRKLNEESRSHNNLEHQLEIIKSELDRKKSEFVSILNDRDLTIQDLRGKYDNTNMNSIML